MNCDKTEETSVQIFILYERTFSLVFKEKRMVGGGHPLLPEILGKPAPHWSEIADFESIIARSTLSVTPSKKSSINTNRKSPCAFQ